MSLATILILNAAVATTLLVLLGLTMRLPFLLQFSIVHAEQRLRSRRRERAPANPAEAGRRQSERPNAERPKLREPAYSNE